MNQIVVTLCVVTCKANGFPVTFQTSMPCRHCVLPICQAWRKQLRVGPAKIGSSAEGTSRLGGGSEGMPPREILIFSFSKKAYLAHSLKEFMKKQTETYGENCIC